MAKKQPPKIPTQQTEWQDFLDELVVESDRGAALVGGALLDDMLAEMFRAAFVDEPIVPNKPTVADNLLGMDRPLGTPSARTDLAYCLGWIGPDTRHDLKQVQRIRNRFGHVREKLNFGDQQIAAWCSNFKHLADQQNFGGLLANPDGTIVEIEAAEAQKLEDSLELETRDYFIIVVTHLAGELGHQLEKLRHATWTESNACHLTKAQAKALVKTVAKNPENFAIQSLGQLRHKRLRHLKGEV